MSVVWAVMISVLGAPVGAADLPTVDAIRTAVRANFEQVRSVHAAYAFAYPTAATQPADLPPSSPRVLLMAGRDSLLEAGEPVRLGDKGFAYMVEKRVIGPSGFMLACDEGRPGAPSPCYYLYEQEVDAGSMVAGDPRQWGLFVAFERLDMWLGRVALTVLGVEDVDGHACVKVVATDPVPVPKRWRGEKSLLHYALWLDPECGYMPRQVEHGVNAGRPAVRLVVDTFTQVEGMWLPATGRYMRSVDGELQLAGRLTLDAASVAANVEFRPAQFALVPPPGVRVVDQRLGVAVRYEQPYPADSPEFKLLLGDVENRLAGVAADADVAAIQKALDEARRDPAFGNLATSAGRVRVALFSVRLGERLIGLAADEGQRVAYAQQVAQMALNVYSLWADESLLDEALRIGQAARRGLTSDESIATLLSYELNIRACKVLRQTRSRFRAGMSILTETHGVLTLYPKSETLALTSLQVAKDIEDYNEFEAHKLLVVLRDQCGETRAGKLAAGMLRREAGMNEPFDFAVTAMDGRQVSPEAMRGKVLLVQFASGEQPASLADLDGLYRRYQQDGLEVAAVSVDTNVEALKGLLEQMKIAWPVVCDGLGWDSPVVLEYGVDEVPMTFLVDRSGRLRYVTSRTLPEARVRKLLAEPVVGPTTAPATQPAASSAE